VREGLVIDLHCHLLPGLDDGVRTAHDALELARQLTDEGVLKVAATPHLRDDFPDVRVGEIASRCSELNATLDSAGLALEVVPAAEVDLVHGLDATDEELRLASYGGRGTDLLLEAPYGPLPTSFEEHVFRISVRGYRVLLAHPERNPSLQREPARLLELVRRGILLQVTADALLPRPGRSRSGELARWLVSEGVAHVLASDSHGPGRPSRTPLRAGVTEARALAGAYADWMVEEAPAAILAGEPLSGRPTAGRPARRRVRKRLRRGVWRG
jgi:protein-tyrosine phosphatase